MQEFPDAVSKQRANHPSTKTICASSKFRTASKAIAQRKQATALKRTSWPTLGWLLIDTSALWFDHRR
jgi:hypothetical protein